MSSNPASSNDDESNLARSQSFPLEFTISQKTPYLDAKLHDLNADEAVEKETADLQEATGTRNLIEKRHSLPAKNGISVSSNSINERLAVASSYSFWNPLRWLMGSRGESMEEIESSLFKSVQTPIRRYYLPIRNSSLKIWTVSTTGPANDTATGSTSSSMASAAAAESVKTPIVLVHGFCGGIALWIHNIDELSENGQRPFHAFDLIGFGRSSRPLFSADPIVAETQFIESIEDWRREMKIDDMILLGHSFGGYLSTAYAIKYPKRVKALILADPWGFPEKPSASKPESPMPLWIRVVAKLSQFVSPLAVIRLTGQWGIKLFKNLRPDFRHKFESVLDDPDLIYSYIYQANCLPPSGEYGFRTIAEYFGFAKNPMIRRITTVDNNIPVWFVYGGRSWIDHTAGFTSIHLRQNAISTSVKLITGAGHHVYADKPREFNEYVRYIYKLLEDFDKAPTEFFLDREPIRNAQMSNMIPKSNHHHHHH